MSTHVVSLLTLSGVTSHLLVLRECTQECVSTL